MTSNSDYDLDDFEIDVDGIDLDDMELINEGLFDLENEPLGEIDDLDTELLDLTIEDVQTDIILAIRNGDDDSVKFLTDVLTLLKIDLEVMIGG
mgnify:CR=1 FL=1